MNVKKNQRRISAIKGVRKAILIARHYRLFDAFCELDSKVVDDMKDWEALNEYEN